ncbi:MAG: tRNA (N6-isopentenyl adenosine(37)-C2)-methylthiotransferase MiaB [Opitutales bacterium]|nr:tRNA (N6-isopentenyl adenosine(37)-C2)-methylthiotransferase MiaB [Opitutales bacterium]
MNRVFIKTYGCQMNERDSEEVASSLIERGYSLVENEKEADIVLLNTCSVREQAESKAIGKAGHVLSKKKKDKKFILGIMGCMAQNKGADLLKSLPKLSLIAGTQKFHHIPDYLDTLTKQDSNNKLPIIDLDEEANSQSHIKNHLDSSSKTVSAFVSIMQGCNMNCSFCIVPKTRGNERYRAMDEIVAEVEALARNGVKEVTLLGQIVNAYGRGEFARIDNKSPFVQLLDKLHAIDDIKRIRFTSPHPVAFGDDLIAAFTRLNKLGSHAHIPVQSGSDRILKSMNRPYTRSKFIDLVKKLRASNPEMRLSTDVIVGYPGEEEEDFEATKDLFVEAGFEMAFIFKYSERSGTPAAELSDQVPQHVKEKRNQELLHLLEQQSTVSNEKLVGSDLEVLVEGKARKGEGNLIGRTPCFRKVIFLGPDKLISNIVTVRIARISPNTLFGDLIT